jgi:hypothetical protein
VPSILKHTRLEHSALLRGECSRLVSECIPADAATCTRVGDQDGGTLSFPARSRCACPGRDAVASGTYRAWGTVGCELNGDFFVKVLCFLWVRFSSEPCTLFEPRLRPLTWGYTVHAD